MTDAPQQGQGEQGRGEHPQPPAPADQPYAPPYPTPAQPPAPPYAAAQPYPAPPAPPYAAAQPYPAPPAPPHPAPAYGGPQQYPGAQPYAGQAPYGYQSPYASPYPTLPPYEPLAIASISVAGGAALLGFFLTFLAVGAIVGAILGLVALSRIKRTGNRGRGLAIAGTIVGFVVTGFGLIMVLLVVGLIAASVGAGGGYPS